MSKAASSLCLSFDTDWVPPFVLEHALMPTVERGLRATVFCTGAYALPPGMEAALHPNLMPDSTQGRDPESIMAGLLDQVPGAVGVRTHRMYWHGGLYGLFARHGMAYDSSMLLPFQPGLRPSAHNDIVRLPVWWSEAAHRHRGLPLHRFAPPGLDQPGLKVLLFHPIHIYLNSPDPLCTRQVIRTLDELPSATTEQLKPHRNTRTPGMKDLFLHALDRLAEAESATPGSVRTMQEVVKNGA